MIKQGLKNALKIFNMRYLSILFKYNYAVIKQKF